MLQSLQVVSSGWNGYRLGFVFGAHPGCHKGNRSWQIRFFLHMSTLHEFGIHSMQATIETDAWRKICKSKMQALHLSCYIMGSNPFNYAYLCQSSESGSEKWSKLIWINPVGHLKSYVLSEGKWWYLWDGAQAVWPAVGLIIKGTIPRVPAFSLWHTVDGSDIPNNHRLDV